MLYPLSYRRMPPESDWSRIAERLGVAEISVVLDRRAASRQDRRVLRLVLAALVLVGTGALAGCTDDQPTSGPAAEGGVQASPAPPHVAGPLPVELRPALKLTGRGDCHPEAGRLCSTDDTAYRVLGAVRPAFVDEVVTEPSPDRTSWGTTVRFADESADAVRRARAEAAGFGGVVLVTGGEGLISVVNPRDLTPRRATFLGLEKAEAWAIVTAFSRSK
jgi:hypothetical protein